MPIPGPSSFPSVSILLDDGTGTFPYDVSSYVLSKYGLTWNRGRQDELSANQPGQLTLTLDNTDGRFTVGNGTYNIALDRQIRVMVNGANRWTGALQSLPVSWASGSDVTAEVSATAVDALATFQRRTLLSATSEGISDNFRWYWPCNDPNTATSARNINARVSDATNASLIASLVGGGAGVVFDVATSMPDGSTGIKLTSSTTGDNGYLHINPGSYGNMGGATAFTYTIAFQFSGPIPPGGLMPMGDLAPQMVGDVNIAQIFAGGFAESALSVGNWGANLDDGNVHVITIIAGWGGNAIGIVDGATVFTHAFTPAGSGYYLDSGFSVGQGFTASSSVTCTVMHVGFTGTAVDPAVITNWIHPAVLTDMNPETVDQRLTRLASYVDVPVGTLDATGHAVLGIASQDGTVALDAVNITTDAELGTAFVDKNGALSYVSGVTLSATTTPAAILDANWFGEDTSFVVDLQGLVNHATGTTPEFTAVNVVPQVAEDATSVALHGRYDTDYTWYVNTADQVLALMQWKIGVYAEPQPRCPTLTVDVMTMDVVNRTAALGLDLGSFLRVTGMPSQTPGGTTVDLIVQGITETITVGGQGTAEWSLSLNVAPRVLWETGVYDNATYGIYDVSVYSI